MQSVRVTKRYAKAMLNFALEQNQAQEAYNELMELVQAIEGNSDFKALLSSPIVKSSVKMAVLNEVFVKKTPVVERFIELLSENKRLTYLYAIAKEYCQIFLIHKGQTFASITTAKGLSEKMEGLVLQKIKELTGGENIALKNYIDESIIGGFILRLGDVQYNASVSHQINQVKKQFLRENA